ncbi:unnamed protein product [Ilex paraguariensis]|uniref:Uncharacterized protein n=1 Tax=Ilex paraguariensis TaxID=185542 RepID=A0ABC8RLM3_9AQUA
MDVFNQSHNGAKPTPPNLRLEDTDSKQRLANREALVGDDLPFRTLPPPDILRDNFTNTSTDGVPHHIVSLLSFDSFVLFLRVLDGLKWEESESLSRSPEATRAMPMIVA